MSHFPIQIPFSIVSNTHFDNKNLVHSSYIPSNSFNSHQQNSFLNRNTREQNMSSSSIGKSNYPEGHNMKLRRQNSLNVSIQLKQNNPYSQNCNTLNFLNCAGFSRKQQLQNNNQTIHNVQNSYYNPLISKRSKKAKQIEDNRQNVQYFNAQDFEKQKEQLVKINRIAKQNSFGNTQIFHQELTSLKKRISQLQKNVQSNKFLIDEHQKKINDKSKNYTLQNSQIMNQKHLRSLSTATNSSKSYRELTEIMTLIEQTKDYQRKNSQQYRKTIEQFRNTILEFRGELNQTLKRKDYQVQINKIKDSVQQIKSKIYSKDSQNIINKDLVIQNIMREQFKNVKSQILLKLEQKILEIKSQVSKLQENQISFKADIVKITVRQKMTAQQNQLKKTEFNKFLSQLKQKIESISSKKCEIFKTGDKYQGKVLSFLVEQTLIKCQSESFSVKNDQNTNLNLLKNNQNVINTIVQIDNKKFSKDPISLSKKTYYIDTEGYLLDQYSRYLINENGQTIKISNIQLSLLRKYGILTE